MRKMVLLVLAMVLAMSLGCRSGTGSAPVEEPAPAAGQSDAPVSTMVVVSAEETAGAVREEVTIEAVDGLALAGTQTRPAGGGPFPGVVLLHMLGSERSVWDEVGLTGRLVESGVAVLAVDMRGYGQTGGAVDWEQAPEDHVRVWQAFAARDEIDETRTAVIGASIGANLALRLGADVPEVAAVVMLSPGLEYRGVTADDQIVLYGDRPLFITASENDRYSADSSDTLSEFAEGDLLTEIYPDAGHGTDMLAAEPELAELLSEWLSQYLGPG